MYALVGSWLLNIYFNRMFPFNLSKVFGGSVVGRVFRYRRFS